MSKTTISLGLSVAAVILLGAGCKDKKTADDYLQSGQQLYKQEMFDKARVQFRNALAMDSANSQAHFGLAMLAKAKEDHQAQQFHLQKAVQLNPSDALAQFEFGEISLLMGDLASAKNAEQALIGLQPKGEQHYQLAVAVAIAEQDWEKAEQLSEAALQAYPENAQLWGLLGVAEKKQSHWEAALRALDQAIALEDNNLQYRLLRIEVNQERGDIEASIDDLTALITNVDNPEAQIIRLTKLINQRDGRAAAIAKLETYINKYPQAYALQTLHVDLVKLDDQAQAGQLLDQYIQAASNPTGLLFYRIYAALSNNNITLAQHDLNTILEREGQDEKAQAEAKALLAELAWLQGDLETANELLEQVLAINSTHPRALLLKAKWLTQNARADEAVVYLNKLLSQDATSIEALTMLGSFYQQQGKNGIASDLYQRILQQDPQNYAALRFKISEAFSKEHLTNTDALLARALKQYPKDTALLSVKLQVAALRSRFGEANDLLKMLEDLDVNRADILFFKGYIHQQQGNHKQALSFFSEAVNERGEFDKALQAMYTSAQGANALSDLKVFLAQHIKVNEDDLTAQLLLAQLQASVEPQRAIDNLQRALKKHPHWIPGSVMLAKLYLQVGHEQQGFNLLEQTYTQSGDVSAGIAYARQLELQEAFTDAGLVYEMLLQTDTDNNVVRNNYAMLLSGKLASRQSLRKALQLSESFASSNNPALLDTYGVVLTEAGKTSEAIYTLKKALEIADLPEIRLHYADALYRSGKQEQAQTILQQVADKSADNDVLQKQIDTLKQSWRPTH